MLPRKVSADPAACPSAGHRSAGEAVAALAAEITSACDLPTELRRIRVKTALANAVAEPRLLKPEQRVPGTVDYARHILYSDPDDRFTILAIVWAAGQFSPPHAHHTWCAYAVYENALEETTYAWDAAQMTARPCGTAARRPAYCCFSEAGLDQIHRLGNSGSAPAISIHVYGVSRDDVRTGVNRMVALDQEGRCR